MLTPRVLIVILLLIANDSYCVFSMAHADKQTTNVGITLNVDEYLGEGSSKIFTLTEYRNNNCHHNVNCTMQVLVFNNNPGNVEFYSVPRYRIDMDGLEAGDFMYMLTKGLPHYLFNYTTDILDVDVNASSYLGRKRLTIASILIALKEKKFVRFSKKIMDEFGLKVVVNPLNGRATVVTPEMEKTLFGQGKIQELAQTDESGTVNVNSPDVDSLSDAERIKQWEKFQEMRSVGNEAFITPHNTDQNVATTINSIFSNKIYVLSGSLARLMKDALLLTSTFLFTAINKIIFFLSVVAILIALMYLAFRIFFGIMNAIGWKLTEAAGILSLIPIGGMFLWFLAFEMICISTIVHLPSVLITNNITHYRILLFGSSP